jgi:RHS repeat-associated protein
MKTIKFLILGLLASVVVMQPFSGRSQSGQPTAPVAEAVTPQIQALAQGLQNDPAKIFNYVHDHIRYVHYFGSKKGAQLTLLEKSGNDFDQSALLTALLNAAGYNNTGYEFQWIGPVYNDFSGEDMDLRHWFQLTLVNTNWTSTLQCLDGLFGSRGYPETVNFTGYTNLYLFQHVWVSLTTGGNTYWLDPSFKVSEFSAGINLTNAMGFSSNNLMSASVAGGTDTGNYVTNLNEANIRSALTGYTTNLLNYLQSNAPNASVQQIMGGWQIVPSPYTNLSQIDANFPFNDDLYPIDPEISWTYEPTNLMASLKITFAGTNYQCPMPQLQGQRLSLTFSNNGVAQLWQEDAPLAQHSTSGSGTTNVVFAINQPYGTWNDTSNVLVDTGFGDQVITNLCQATNATYVLTYAFEPDWGWLQQRQNQLDSYRQQGLPDTSRQVVSETLNVMALNWMLQTASAEQLLAGQLGILPEYSARFGRMAQETGHGYYIDVQNFGAAVANSGLDTVSLNHESAHIDLNQYFASALENGVIEQFQPTNLQAASTIKMLQIANTNGQAVYLASSTNWTGTPNVQGKLVNYDTATKSIITGYINAGYYVMLPQNGSNHVSGTTGWAGYGYVTRLRGAGLPLTNVTGMIISGGYHGGYAGDPNATANSSTTAQDGDSQPFALTADSPFNIPDLAGDPVDMTSGTFQVEHTDLSVGQAEPRGMTLSRYYNGTRRFSNPAGMADGWVHNYSVNANTVPAPQAALGSTTPQQMAPMIAATCAAANLYNSSVPDPKNWMVSALIAKWGIDQLNKNGVSVIMGKDTVQFVKQPNGTFTPPADCTMTLAQNGSAYSLSQRHGNTFQFDALGRLTNIVDQYSQSVTLTYNTSNLVSTVTDWKKNRTLTFGYTGSQLTSVSDNSSPARSISYGYTSGDLTSFTDAEGKTTTYTYGTNHLITTTIDAATRLVISNLYDALGHVTTQYTQGDTNKTWKMFWSGWQSIEQDPIGSQRIYSYDNQSRVTSLRDALGDLTQTFYDGQGHVVISISPLNETNQFFYDGNHNVTNSIDALGFTNQFAYDNQNNLIRSVDGRGNPTTFGYNNQFSITGQTNGAGDFVNYAYNGDGTLHSRTDSGGMTVYDTYDIYGQLTHITYPNSLGGESFVNNLRGDPTSHTDANGNITTFAYNNRRELTNTVAPTNLTVIVSFDAVGNVSGNTDARGNAITKTWSATRKLLATALPSTPQGMPVITNNYDSRDLLVKMVDPLQNPTLYTNDVAGRLVSQTDPVLRTTTFGYDADGRKLAATNAAQEVASQTWDARGSMLQLTDGAGHFSTRAYDAAGNQIILTNRNGKKWQFQFDGANRLTNTITPRGFSTSLSFNHQGLLSSIKDQANQPTSFYYDAKGRLTNRTDNVATTLYGFDANGNRTSATENSQTNSWTYDAYNRISSCKDIYGNLIQYRYDANGNVTNLIYPGGKNVYYAYDSLNRVTNVTDWAGRKSAMTYDLNSHITGLTRPNGSYRTISYDAAGQATNIYEQMANSLPIAIFKYNWTNSGNMAWEFAAPLPHTNTVPTRNMTYDDDNRLLTVNSLNVYSDADGNLTNAPMTNNTLVSYAYDARNRLLNASGVTNAYDTMNNRIGQANGTNTTIFVVNPNAKLPQVLMRIKNGVTNYYIYGDGLLYQVTETATGTNTLTYHYDYRGSTIALSADNGLVTDRIEYSAYGLTTYRTGTSDTPFLFNGRYGVMTDPNGLLYMRARYYNPYLCRFLNPDPTGFSAGLNFYAYANGNPVSYLDPFGLNVGTTGDNSWSWTSIYNSIANLVVPGQAALNGAYSSFQAGNYWTAALNVANAVGQDVLFALTAGGSSVTTSGLNAAGGTVTTLGENDVVIGFVQNGQIIGQSTLGSDFATALSHEQLASQLGILESPGVLSEGAEAFTVWSENGQIMIRGSNNFVPTLSPLTQTILQQSFR